MVRPQNKTLLEVVSYLDSISLNVYGRNTDLSTGEQFCSLQDYTAEEVVTFRKLLEGGNLYHEDTRD